VIELAMIEAARDRIAGAAIRTPLIRLPVRDTPAEIYLKLENLQPINSFKIRGAANAILLAPASERAKGLVTASAGNMAQGVAWMARELGVPALRFFSQIGYGGGAGNSHGAQKGAAVGIDVFRCDVGMRQVRR